MQGRQLYKELSKWLSELRSGSTPTDGVEVLEPVGQGGLGGDEDDEGVI